MTRRDTRRYSELSTFIADAASAFERIADDRRVMLRAISDFVLRWTASGEVARLTFICTHNSRRSQLAQIWAQTAAHVYVVPGVETYSGGTEATAFNPRAVAAMRRAGFRIDGPDGGDNPFYRVRFAERGTPIECFSKVYDQPPNPREGFAAVMTCSAADAACPVVLGAAERISLPYDDPQDFDGTDWETAAYDERCQEIAREMLYAFSRIER